jgi:hypothetical protein
MLDLQQVQVTRFQSVTSTNGKAVPLSDVIEELRNPGPEVLTVLREIKSALDPEESDRLKKRLPAVTFAGTFPNGRKRDRIGAPSNLVVLDFDTYKDPSAEPHKLDLLKRLRDDESVVLYFQSPRGGIKAVAIAEGVSNDDDFKDAFATLKERYPEADESGKDLTRLCFLSHDPELYLNTKARPFKVKRGQGEPLFQAPEEPRGVESTPVTPSSASAKVALEHIANVLRLGAKRKDLDPATSRHEFMLSAATTARRYVLGGHLSEEQARSSVARGYASLFGGDGERMRDAERAYDGARRLAEEKGPLHPTTERKAYETAEDVPEDTLAEKWLRVFAPHWDNEPPYVEPVYRFMGADVGQVGSFTVVKAQPKAGKTTVALAMWTAYYFPADSGKDTFGFTVTAPLGKDVCLYFDSEQGRRESHQAWARALKRVGITSAEQMPEAMRETMLCLTDVTNNVERQALLFDAIQRYGEHLGAIVVDGVADFIVDVNDAHEVDDFVQRLRAVVSEYDICAVLTIHENIGQTKGPAKERGHLGSDLARRAAATLGLAKDRNTGIHTLTITQNRRGADYLKTSFRYDDALGTHVSQGVELPKPLSDDDSGVLAQYRGKKVQYRELVSALELTGKRKDAAKKAVTRWARKGHIRQVGRGVYFVPEEEAVEEVLFPDAEDVF